MFYINCYVFLLPLTLTYVLSYQIIIVELSVQLRKLQSEKNAQANDIDRLERQIKILSELKGIGITDLQDALRAACEAEAHGEMNNLVGKLQARIDVLELSGGAVGGRRWKGRVGDDVPNQHQFNEEAAARTRTALELKIGELEEIESSLRSELNSLYQNIHGLQERNTFLETQLIQQKALLDQWERRWQAKEDEEKKRNCIVPMAMPSGSGSYNYSEFAQTTNNGGHQPALLHNIPQSQIDSDLQQRLIAAETALAGEKQQRTLLESQLTSTKERYELKQDQYKHRIQFLEGQLRDLEQQMSSLYTAFGIMSDDNKQDRSEKEAWKRTLLESDAAIAQETERESLSEQQEATPEPERRARRSLRLLNPPTPAAAVAVPRAAVKPAAHPPIAKGLLYLLLDKDDKALPPTHSQEATPRQKSFSARKLLPKSSSRNSSATALKFKRQYCVLHGANGLYQIRYGDSYEGPVSGVHEFLTAGVSSIEHTSRSSSKDFGFEIMINANDIDAPALCCAAESEEDFMMWMSALTSIFDGSIETQFNGSVNQATIAGEVEAYADGVSPAI